MYFCCLPVRQSLKLSFVILFLDYPMIFEQKDIFLAKVILDRQPIGKPYSLNCIQTTFISWNSWTKLPAHIVRTMALTLTIAVTNNFQSMHSEKK